MTASGIREVEMDPDIREAVKFGGALCSRGEARKSRGRVFVHDHASLMPYFLGAEDDGSNGRELSRHPLPNPGRNGMVQLSCVADLLAQESGLEDRISVWWADARRRSQRNRDKQRGPSKTSKNRWKRWKSRRNSYLEELEKR